MKTRASVKLICKYCTWEKRKNRLYVRCDLNPKHKQRQLFSSSNLIPIDNSSYELDGNDTKEHTCVHIESLKHKVAKSEELKFSIKKNTLI